MTRLELFLPVNAMPFFYRRVERDAADRHSKIFLDLLFCSGIFGPMASSKSPVDFGIFCILRSEISVELFFCVDLLDVAIPEFSCAIEEVLLDILELAENSRKELFARLVGEVAVPAVASRDGQFIAGDIARPDLNAHGDAFLDPGPEFVAAAHFPFIDDDVQRPSFIL